MKNKRERGKEISGDTSKTNIRLSFKTIERLMVDGSFNQLDMQEKFFSSDYLNQNKAKEST